MTKHHDVSRLGFKTQSDQDQDSDAQDQDQESDAQDQDLCLY